MDASSPNLFPSPSLRLLSRSLLFLNAGCNRGAWSVSPISGSRLIDLFLKIALRHEFDFPELPRFFVSFFLL